MNFKEFFQLNEANIYYQLPKDKEILMYDFYALALVEGMTNFNNKYMRGDTAKEDEKYGRKTKTPSIEQNVKYFDSDSPEWVSYLDAKEKIMGYLYPHLLDAVFVSMSCEVRHTPTLPDKTPEIKKIFGDYKRELARYSVPVRDGGYDPDTIQQRAENKSGEKVDKSRSASVAACQNLLKKYPREKIVEMFVEAFVVPGWSGGFGGKNWQNIAIAWLDLYRSKTEDEKIKNIDIVFDLQHNTDTVFNKLNSYMKSSRSGSYSWIKRALDFKRYATARELLNEASSIMKKLTFRILQRYNPELIKELDDKPDANHQTKIDQFIKDNTSGNLTEFVEMKDIPKPIQNIMNKLPSTWVYLGSTADVKNNSYEFGGWELSRKDVSILTHSEYKIGEYNQEFKKHMFDYMSSSAHYSKDNVTPNSYYFISYSDPLVQKKKQEIKDKTTEKRRKKESETSSTNSNIQLGSLELIKPLPSEIKNSDATMKTLNSVKNLVYLGKGQTFKTEGKFRGYSLSNGDIDIRQNMDAHRYVGNLSHAYYFAEKDSKVVKLNLPETGSLELIKPLPQRLKNNKELMDLLKNYGNLVYLGKGQTFATNGKKFMGYAAALTLTSKQSWSGNAKHFDFFAEKDSEVVKLNLAEKEKPEEVKENYLELIKPLPKDVKKNKDIMNKVKQIGNLVYLGKGKTFQTNGMSFSGYCGETYLNHDSSWKGTDENAHYFAHKDSDIVKLNLPGNEKPKRNYLELIKPLPGYLNTVYAKVELINQLLYKMPNAVYLGKGGTFKTSGSFMGAKIDGDNLHFANIGYDGSDNSSDYFDDKDSEVVKLNLPKETETTSSVEPETKNRKKYKIDMIFKLPENIDIPKSENVVFLGKTKTPSIIIPKDNEFLGYNKHLLSKPGMMSFFENDTYYFIDTDTTKNTEENIQYVLRFALKHNIGEKTNEISQTKRKTPKAPTTNSWEMIKPVPSNIKEKAIGKVPDDYVYLGEMKDIPIKMDINSKVFCYSRKYNELSPAAITISKGTLEDSAIQRGYFLFAQKDEPIVIHNIKI